jgi:hypothetical protein
MKQKLKSLYHFLSSKKQTIFLDYKIKAHPRALEKNCLSLLENIKKNETLYHSHLEKINERSISLLQLNESKDETDNSLPTWNNGFLPGMDIINLYGMITIYQPKIYIEIGSGNSTKVAKKSIQDNALKTKIISIDPFPRAEIDDLADEVIREGLENIKNISSIISQLEAGDILFIDNSHWCFPNSDVMVCFLEILPQLAKGVIVHFHDIYLPYDYPQFMCNRFYNEQYMLAAFIISNPIKYKPILPNYYIYENKHLHQILNQYWLHPNLKNVEQHGGSFWLEIGQ